MGDEEAPTAGMPQWMPTVLTVLGTAVVALFGVGVSLITTVQTDTVRLTSVERHVEEIDQNGSRGVVGLESRMKSLQDNMDRLNSRMDRLDDRLANLHAYLGQFVPPKSGALPPRSRGGPE